MSEGRGHGWLRFLNYGGSMFKSALVAFATLASATTFAAGIDFNNIPKDSLVMCEGVDSLNSDENTEFGVTSVYTPHQMLGGLFNYAHIVTNLADPTQSIQVPANVQKVETIADAAALKTFLLENLGSAVNPEAIDNISAGEANYPMTAVTAYNVVPDEKGNPTQLDILVNVYGWSQKNEDGSTLEFGMSLYLTAALNAPAAPAPTIAPAAFTQTASTQQQSKAPATQQQPQVRISPPELASYSFNTCGLAKIADVLAPATPPTQTKQVETQKTQTQTTQDAAKTTPSQQTKTQQTKTQQTSAS